MKGYWLNRAFNDLREPAARSAWQADLDAYLAGYPLTEDEKQCVRDGDWPGCIERGVSVYTLTKVGATTGESLLQMGATMRGQTMAQFTEFLTEQNAAAAPLQLLPEPAEASDG